MSQCAGHADATADFDSTTPSALSALERHNLSQIENYLGPNIRAKIVSAGDARLRPIFRAQWKQQIPDVEKAYCIQCGPASKNLCALVFLEPDDAHKFLAANPDLAGTKATIWAGLAYVWLRLSDWSPPSDYARGVLWITTDLIPVANLAPYQNFPAVTPQDTVRTVAYGRIQWPEVLVLPFFLKQAVYLWGEITHQVKGKPVLNHRTLARVIPRILGLHYQVEAGAFMHRQTDGSFKLLSLPTVIQMVTQFLHGHAQALPNFPMNELRPARVKELVWEMSIVAAVTGPSAQESLEEFVRQHLIAKVGASVTSEEVYAEYLKFAKQQRITLVSRLKFSQQFPPVVLDTFNVTQVHNVLRSVGGTNRLTARRGFNGLAFKTPPPDAGDAKDDTDGIIHNPAANIEQ